MRLQLTRAATLAALVASAPMAAAFADGEPQDGSVASKTSLYADDDATTVVTTVVDGEASWPRFAVGAHVLVDVVSTASVDVVTAATSRWDEVRAEQGGRVTARPHRDLDLGVGYVHSREPDWTSNSARASAAWEIGERKSLLRADYGFTHNSIGRRDDLAFEKRLRVHTSELSFAVPLDRRTLVSVAYTLQASDGFHASPYRRVETADGSFSAPETHPDRRLRHAATLRALRQLGRRVALDGSYRFYTDDWGIRSHMFASALVLELGEYWDARVRARAYTQSPALFWRESYQDPMRYMSADREVSTLWNMGGGGRVGFHSGGFEIDLKADVYHYRFLDFAPLPRRLAVVTAVGVGYEW